MSRKSTRKHRGGAREGEAIATTQTIAQDLQLSQRFSVGWRAGLVALVVAAVVVSCAGWHFLHRRGQPENRTQGIVSGDAAGPPTGIEAIHNILLVSIDTCRADHLGCYGYKRPTTPNIDAVARDGAMFKMALTPVPLTKPAHCSMFTGMYPPTHGVHWNTSSEHLADTNVTLAKVLRQAGHQTAAFIGGFPLDARFGLNRGFDTYDGYFDNKGSKGLDQDHDAEQVTRRASPWLDEHAKRPFFLFLHFYDAHVPYAPHPPYTSQYDDDLYAGEIAYIDHNIGQVLDRLRALGVYDNTLLIITGDHGEGLGEHGEMKHGYFIYQSTLRVPLVIRAPHCGQGIQVDGNVSLVDIVPTVLKLVGLKVPAGVEGVDLRPVLEGRPAPDQRKPVLAESLEAATFGCSPLHGIVDGNWKYILAPRPELYDLNHDPGEETNLASRETQVAQRLRGRLEAMTKELEAVTPTRVASKVDHQALKRLQSLGYVDGGARPPASILDTQREDAKDFLAVYQRIDKAMTLFSADHRSELAKKEVLEIAAIRPDLIWAHKQLAGIAMEEGRPAGAVEQYAKIVAMLGDSNDPSKKRSGDSGDLANAHFGLGLALWQAGNRAEAIAHYRKAVEIKPEFVDAHSNLGIALVGSGQLDEAIGHYRTVLKIEPENVECHNNLGVALASSGQADEAIGHYRKVLEITPNDMEAHYNLGIALAGRQKAAEAIVHLRKALGLAAARNERGAVDVIQTQITRLQSSDPAGKVP
jgi:arylsulfatase A-like enzyme/Tfp pilus assembly protein PilF